MQQGWISSDFIVKSSKKSSTLISGYASVFDTSDNHNDIIKKGAFKNAKSDKVKLLWQHDQKKPIGVISFLEEDEYGLAIEAEINNDTSAGAEASSLIKQGAINGLSIGFSIKSSDYDKKGSRVIDEVELMEVSVVTFPANVDASITQVKKDSMNENSEDAEKLNELSKLIKQIENY